MSDSTKSMETEDTKPKADTKEHIKTLEHLIEYAYKQKGRKITLEDKTEKAILSNKDIRLDEASRNSLLELSKQDRLLAVPRQLLLVAVSVRNRSHALQEELRKFVEKALLTQPLFKNGGDSIFTEDLTAEEMLKRLTEFSPESGASDFNPKEFEKLRVNAINCLAVWLFTTRGCSISDLCELLSKQVWLKRSMSLPDDLSDLRALTEIEDFAGVSAATRELKKILGERDWALDRANHDLSNTRKERDLLRARSERQNEDIGRLQAKVAQLEQSLETERNNSKITQTHLHDDLEQQRTRVLRRLKSDSELLNEGLIALRRDPPKVKVMDDHAERVADSLRQEIKRLESGE